MGEKDITENISVHSQYKADDEKMHELERKRSTACSLWD